MEKTTTLRGGFTLRGKGYVYHIEQVLGQGSFGITYLATTKVSVKGELGNIETEIRVAIKEFYMREFCSRHEDGTMAEMTQGTLVANYARKFRKEAENLAKLSHPNIVKVLEVFDANNTTYYAMEYIPGGSLDAYVKQQDGLPEEEAIACIRQIGSALSYMHDHKMLHLDLKPSNVMRSSDGSKLTLIDFGLSKQYEENGNPESSTSIGLGTLGYAPIEQSSSDRDRDFAPTLDVYALGATFYKLLTGQTPPQASAVLDEGFPTGVLQQKGISSKSIEALEQAMEPRKSKRLKTVDSFLSALGSMSDDEGTEIDTPKEQEPEKPLKPEKPQSKEPSPKPSFPKWLYGVVAMIVAAVVVFLVIGKGNQYVAVESINVTPSELSLKEGESNKLSVEFTPENATDKSVVWISSDNNVAKVDNATGDVTALKAGKSTITAASGGKQSECAVTVTAVRKVVPVESITLSKSNLAVEEGGNATLTVRRKPSDATETKTDWESTDPQVVTVSKTGKVTALKAGSASIIATCGGKTAYCNVTVKPKAQQQSQSQNQSSQLSNQSQNQSTRPSQGSTTGKHYGREYVDLGLPSGLLWATCNVGASNPSDYGDYYAWGETVTKGEYHYNNVAYYKGENSSNEPMFTKYVTSSKHGDVDNKTRLDLSDDAARANLGGSWRMPTVDEWKELMDNCTWRWTSQGGHNGYNVSGKNGAYIFLPYAGYREGSSFNKAGEGGFYWSSSLYTGISFIAFSCDFYSGYVAPSGWHYRSYGLSVRPVVSALQK